jgi:16S rRNA (uracil1498-N3)-methyltransferase
MAAVEPRGPVVAIHDFEMKRLDAVAAGQIGESRQRGGSDAAATVFGGDIELVDEPVATAELQGKPVAQHRIADRHIPRPDDRGTTVNRICNERAQGRLVPRPVGMAILGAKRLRERNQDIPIAIAAFGEPDFRVRHSLGPGFRSVAADVRREATGNRVRVTLSKPPRLYVDAALTADADVVLSPEHSHYLLNVMRRGDGDRVLLFNGRDGEWRADLRRVAKKSVNATPVEQVRPQGRPPDLHYCFAPIKRARVDFIAQKATELGAALLQPVLTRHTVAERVKIERLRANAVEAAEQCGVLWVPQIEAPVTFERFLEDREPGRTLVFCDEAAEVADPIAALRGVPEGPLAVLIGPEGGFCDDERGALIGSPGVVAISLGPRVMRADTAGLAALALVQAVKGDWRGSDMASSE